MFSENGCTWIPPPLDAEASRREEEKEKRKQEDLERQKLQRRFHNSKRGFLTGRQIEQGRGGGPDGGGKLTPEELQDFDRLCRQELCVSRDSICRAMAFCFEKSGAARHISVLLRGLFINIPPETSVDTLISRLFLISDVVFNSQQPGVRNAFLYRSSIENMSQDAFASVGNFARNNFRFTGRKRLNSAITAVLGAWANWGVYDPVSLDELQACFEGKDITAYRIKTKDLDANSNEDTEAKSHSSATDHVDEASFKLKPKGEWTTVVETEEDVNKFEDTPQDPDWEPMADIHEKDNFRVVFLENGKIGRKEDADGEPLEDVDGEPLENDPDGEPLEDVLDGDPLEGDADGEALEDGADGEPLEHDADGEALEDGADGEPLEDDADGEALEYGADEKPLEDDADGKPLEDDADEKPLEDDADGEQLDDDADGEPLEDDADGEPLEDDADGEPLGDDADVERFNLIKIRRR